MTLTNPLSAAQTSGANASQAAQTVQPSNSQLTRSKLHEKLRSIFADFLLVVGVAALVGAASCIFGGVTLSVAIPLLIVGVACLKLFQTLVADDLLALQYPK
jgi:fatty acid desaturase